MLRTIRMALEYHFLEVGGRVYTDLSFDYAFWSEYLDVFDRVEPIARIGRAAKLPEGWRRADGDGVQFRPIHDYCGIWQFLRSFPRVFFDCGRAVRDPGPVLLRTGAVSIICWLHLMIRCRPYAYESLAHAGEEASRVVHVQVLGLGRLIGLLLHALSRCVALNASCANYVSRHLRRLYPTRSHREWVISDVKLPEAAFASPRPPEAFKGGVKRIISVGRVEPAKGHDVLIRAVAELKQHQQNSVSVEIVGPGRQIPALCKLANELCVADRVKFPGFVPPGPPLTALLDRADLFVLPSLTEGMPRALLEAMARGLPAIGSRTGGIIELLDDDCLVEPGDAAALSKRLSAVLNDAETLARMSAASVKKARGYHEAEMRSRKHAFWGAILAAGPRANRGPDVSRA